MKKIELRAIEPSDINLIYSWENDHEIWKVSNTLVPFSRYLLEQYILTASNSDIYSAKQLRLMIDLIEKGDLRRTIGTLDLFDFDPHNSRAGIGILIDSSERGKGYAKLALQELIHYAFNVLLIHQLYCNISSQNIISLKLFQDLGFQIIGVKKDWLKTNNEYTDECFLQLINNK